MPFSPIQVIAGYIYLQTTQAVVDFMVMYGFFLLYYPGRAELRRGKSYEPSGPACEYANRLLLDIDVALQAMNSGALRFLPRNRSGHLSGWSELMPGQDEEGSWDKGGWDVYAVKM